ncbi:hypothetical protein KFE25_012242 [Diacronema lutheri]|uniref:VPS9 domain-containing protein n=2 Tax=Diacronema lutheri TaxID=2081491 RepID=A0A8J5XJD1_DIALT|nr:hypothetical protein KFE25_012242 [Diacronema lutheri]
MMESCVAAAKVAPAEGTLGLLSELRQAVKSQHPETCVSDAPCLASGGAFVRFLQSERGGPLVLRMKQFVHHVEGAPALVGEALALAVREFYLDADALLLAPGAGVELSAQDALDGARDGLEQYVMGRLSRRAMPVDTAAQAEERELHARCKALAPILTPARLGMVARFSRGAPWPEAQAELRAMERFATPRHKLACLLNCCARLNRSLADSARAHAAEAAAQAAARAGAPAGDDASAPCARESDARSCAHGADELLPALVTVMLHCTLRPLAASLAYAGAYRHPLRLEADGEARYYLTLALSSAQFIRTCGAAQLVGVSERAFAAALAFGLSAVAADDEGAPSGGRSNEIL